MTNYLCMQTPCVMNMKLQPHVRREQLSINQSIILFHLNCEQLFTAQAPVSCPVKNSQADYRDHVFFLFFFFSRFRPISLFNFLIF